MGHTSAVASAQHPPPDLPALLDRLEAALDHALPAQRVAEHHSAWRLLWRWSAGAKLKGAVNASHGGGARMRQREYRIFRAGFDGAARLAREKRAAELEKLHTKTARLKALRLRAEGKPST
jgi:hypothetical protein